MSYQRCGLLFFYIAYAVLSQAKPPDIGINIAAYNYVDLVKGTSRFNYITPRE